MKIIDLDDEYSISAQLSPGDLCDIAGYGFKSVICYRPDREEDGQPSFAEISAAAQAVGLQARYLPVAIGRMNATHIVELEKALSELPAPVLAYCRSGLRATTLYQAAGRTG